jgi:hypothetical protein
MECTTVLTTHFPEEFTGRGGAIPRSPRSPDETHPRKDFRLWICWKGKSLWDRSSHWGGFCRHYNLPKQLVTLKGTIRCHCEACTGGGSIVCTSVAMFFQCANKSSPQDQNVLEERKSEARNETCYKGRNLLFLSLSITGDKVICYVKNNCFSFV